MPEQLGKNIVTWLIRGGLGVLPRHLLEVAETPLCQKVLGGRSFQKAYEGNTLRAVLQRFLLNCSTITSFSQKLKLFSKNGYALTKFYVHEWAGDEETVACTSEYGLHRLAYYRCCLAYHYIELKELNLFGYGTAARLGYKQRTELGWRFHRKSHQGEGSMRWSQIIFPSESEIAELYM